ncbi:MAG TPA: efflux RND transporter periplasmic adaptor subunit [Stellaceae bacterium]|nr:efflux RND transporter periplasmic adaptor subunit [Stellaceae bacterium]
MRHAIASACIALLLCAGAAGLVRAQAPAAPAVTVSAPLQKEIVEWDEFTGQFAAIDFVEIRARVNGYLTEIHFQDGQVVHKGDLLFVIDPRPYEAALASAQAQLAQGQAQVDLATRQLGRSSALLQRGWEPQSNTDQRVSDLKVAQASVEAAQAAIQTAQLNVEFTHITAPITGRISNHRVSIGNLVTGGDAGSATLLTTIVSLDPIYFYFDVNEAEFLAYQRAIAKGNLQDARANAIPAELHLTDEQGWPHKGKINFVDNQVDRGSGTIRVRAEFDNPDLLFTAGQFGRIRVPASERYKAVLIPDEALVSDQSRKLVMTVNADNVVVPKVVRPGPRHDGLRIIRNGLSPDDKIVIDGLLRARPGAKVTPQPGTITADASPD